MNHTRLAPLAALLACTAATTLTACDNKTPAPTPSATTTAPITALPTPMESASASTSTGPLYTQAVAVYRKNAAGFEILVKEGGLAMSTPTPAAMTETLFGQALTKQRNELEQIKMKGFSYVSGDIKVMWVKPLSEDRVGSTVALQSCEDGTKLITKRGSSTFSGLRIRRRSYYTLVDGKLKMVDYLADKVATCAQ